MSLGGTKLLKLPMGYRDNGSVLDDIEIRAMTGAEEDILADDNRTMTDRLNQIITNCTNKLGTIEAKEVIRDAVPHLSIDDQFAILIGLRSISVGRQYKYAVICPSCSTQIQIDLDLDSLRITPSQAKATGLAEVKLPSGAVAKVKPMTIADSMKTESMKLTSDSKLSMAILVRLAELDGKTDLTLEDVRGLLFADRVFLRNFFETFEGGVESELEVECESCGGEFKNFIEIIRTEFFHPKVM